MPRSQDDDYLERRFTELQHDWDSYNVSVPPHARRRRHCRTLSIPNLPSAATPDFFSLLHRSPKKLLSSLQHHPLSPEAEVLTENRSSILSGRRLLEALESVKDETRSSVRSSCLCCTTSLEYSSPSSLSSVVEEPEKMLGRALGGGGGGGGGRWLAGVVWVGLALVVVLAVGALSLSEFGVGEYGEYVIAT